MDSLGGQVGDTNSLPAPNDHDRHRAGGSVELLFFVIYFWLRRQRAGQVLASGRIATPESRLTGDGEEERLCKRGPGR
jgi:hypothetical protein